MSITNYTELQAAITNWSDRSDMALRIPEFIAMAESKINQRLTEFPRASFSATGVDADYLFTSPYLRIIGIALNDGAGGTYNRPLALLDGREYRLWMQDRSVAGGAPTRVFIDTDHPDWADDAGVTLRFWPPLAVANPVNIAVDFIKKPTALSGGNPTNEVLKVAPLVYLYGALAEMSDFLQHPNNVWAEKFETEVGKLNAFGARQHYSGARAPRLPVVFG